MYEVRLGKFRFLWSKSNLIISTLIRVISYFWFPFLGVTFNEKRPSNGHVLKVLGTFVNKIGCFRKKFDILANFSKSFLVKQLSKLSLPNCSENGFVRKLTLAHLALRIYPILPKLFLLMVF